MMFFYLAHGIMSLVCLRNLLKEKYFPSFVIIHKDYEKEKLKETFFEPIIELCNYYGIALIRTKSISELKEKMEGYEFGICLGFMEIIKKEVFEIPKYGILNLHCGKLPEYRGRAPISRAIMNGDEFVTLSIHLMDKGVDSGDILQETKIKIEDNDNVNSMYEKCSKESASSVIECIKKIEAGNPVFIKQNIEPDSKAYRKISYEERMINWKDDIKKIHDLVLALTPPYPCAFSTLNKVDYLFVESEIDSSERNNDCSNGEILNMNDKSMLINCCNGVLKIKSIADESLSVINIKNTFKVGDIFI